MSAIKRIERRSRYKSVRQKTGDHEKQQGLTSSAVSKGCRLVVAKEPHDNQAQQQYRNNHVGVNFTAMTRVLLLFFIALLEVESSVIVPYYSPLAIWAACGHPVSSRLMPNHQIIKSCLCLYRALGSALHSCRSPTYIEILLTVAACYRYAAFRDGR